MATQRREPATIARLRRKLLEWYARNRRDLPWRRNPDPYSIWVSEIMLQQTRVAVVVDRYQSFLARFPTLVSLARAPEQEVLALWSGLGYYRRARMLHKAAIFVVNELDGKLPARSEELRKLPGIGAYTAAAISSIAHGEPVAVVDGNVERVLCRLEGWSAGGRDGAVLKRKVEALATQLLDPAHPGDFNQALMELGATVCVPRNPQCAVCPVAADCKTQGEHKTAARPKMQSREVTHALALRTSPKPNQSHTEVLLEQRPASLSVMPGLWELPALKSAAVPQKSLLMTVRHAIMQVNYYVRIRSVQGDEVKKLTVAGGERRWVPITATGEMALTGLARKVLARARLLARKPPEAVASDRERNVL
jgi:A/G-specific adenine glycosylase